MNCAGLVHLNTNKHITHTCTHARTHARVHSEGMVSINKLYMGMNWRAFSHESGVTYFDGCHVMSMYFYDFCARRRPNEPSCLRGLLLCQKDEPSPRRGDGDTRQVKVGVTIVKTLKIFQLVN